MINQEVKQFVDWCEHDTGLLSIWHTNCYGINVFLCVSDVDETTGMLKLYEIQTKKLDENGEYGDFMVYDNKGRAFKAKKPQDCLFSPINKPNTYTKPSITAMPIIDENGEVVIPYKIEYCSLLYKAICDLNIYKEYRLPKLDLVFKCIGRFKNYKKLINTYWPCPRPKIVANIDEEIIYEA